MRERIGRKQLINRILPNDDVFETRTSLLKMGTASGRLLRPEAVRKTSYDLVFQCFPVWMESARSVWFPLNPLPRLLDADQGNRINAFSSGTSPFRVTGADR